MRFSTQNFLVARASLLAVVSVCVVASARADYIYCVANVSADKTNVCVGEPVSITIDSTTCSGTMTVGSGTNYRTNFPTAGVYTIYAYCSACTTDSGVVSGSSSININVGQLNSITPSSATICPGNYMVFTAESISNDIPCGPNWSLSSTSAGTLTAVGNTATFTLSPAYMDSTATITAACGIVTNTATIYVASSGTFAITSQPVSVLSCPHSNVAFFVGATGTSLSYQWLWNGLILTNGGHFSGATNATLTISNAFATTSVSNSVPAYRGGGGVFFYPTMPAGDTYTYRATGCVTVHGLYMGDAAGDLYTNTDGDCTASSFFAGPTPQWGGCACPGMAAHSLVDRNTCAQFGTNGLFQTDASWVIVDLLANDNSWLDNSGSWEVVLYHTVEGAYSCIVSSSCGVEISAPATLAVSTNCDGIPDSWRLEYFGTTATNTQTCATCTYTNSALDNLQDYQCGLDPLVPYNITTPLSTYSGMWSNTASIPSAGPGVTYSWTVSNGTINSGTYSTTVLWTAGNAGSATLSVTLSGSPSCNSTISTNVSVKPAYYVDYAGGADSSNGTSTASAWQHCPGDHSAQGLAGGKQLNPSDTVFFKGGVTYTLSPQSAVDTNSNQGGIALNWNGTPSSPITYMCTNVWGNGSLAQFVDGYSSNWICAFYNGGSVTGLVFNNLIFGPIGGTATVPTGSTTVDAKPGAGILVGHGLYSVTIENCLFQQLGYWFNSGPLCWECSDANGNPEGIYGEGIQCTDFGNLTITNCEFTEMGIAMEIPPSTAGTNLTVVGCYLHDSIIWGIDLGYGDNNMVSSNNSIFGNTFSNYAQAWANWTGTGGSWPHSEAVFFRADNLTTYSDGNNNVYDNFFLSGGPGGSTAYISLEGGVSLNIYNNVLVQGQNTASISIKNDGQSTTTHTNFVVRVLNNTIICSNTCIFIDCQENGYAWRTTSIPPIQQVFAANNIMYSVSNNQFMGESDISNTNIYPASVLMDYNMYSAPSQPVFDQVVYPSATFLDVGSLSVFGWENHGLYTNGAPGFFDLTGGDYHLSNTVTGIGIGTNLTALGLPGLTRTLDGSTNGRPASGNWDIGAYSHY